MRKYELVFISNPNLDDEATESIINKYVDIIKKQDGELLEIEKIGKRNLAYKIKHLTEGFYATIYFRSIPDVVKELDRVLKIDDNIIRHIIVRHDERQQKKLQENIEKAKESSTEEVKKSNDEEIKESE